MIDTHIHLSHKHFDQTFPYIDLDGKKFKIVSDGRREALIEEMRRRGVSCCLEPAIDVDSNERLLDLSKESGGFILPAVGPYGAQDFFFRFFYIHIIMSVLIDSRCRFCGSALPPPAYSFMAQSGTRLSS